MKIVNKHFWLLVAIVNSENYDCDRDYVFDSAIAVLYDPFYDPDYDRVEVYNTPPERN